MTKQHDINASQNTQGFYEQNDVTVSGWLRGVSTKGVSSNRKPVISRAEFIRSHKRDEERLRKYLKRPIGKSLKLNADELIELSPEAAKFLCANNFDARINFADVVADLVKRRLKNRNMRFAWMTLTPKQFALSEAESYEFDTRRIQAWTRQVLPGMDFFGMVEAALYTNVGNARAGIRRTVSWHVHVFCRGPSVKEFKRLRDLINKRYEPLVPGCLTADLAVITADQLPEKIWYMLKAPQRDYRIYPMKETVTDSETGEISVRTTNRFRQKKDPLRTGDMVRIWKVMAGRQLDQLAFGGSKGKQFYKEVQRRALIPFEKARQRHAGAGRAAYLLIGYRPDSKSLLNDR